MGLILCNPGLSFRVHKIERERESLQQMEMEQKKEMIVKDIVIVGAGIAGLATSLGLHRMGLESLVLESSDSLRVTGFAFTTWTNAWKAIDALGIGDTLRQNHDLLQGVVAASSDSGNPTSEISFSKFEEKFGMHEVRCLRRKEVLETLDNELPDGTIRFNSKVVSIDEEEYSKLVHLADGSIVKAKVLIGCDGVNSVVAKWLGLPPSIFTRRIAIRGFALYEGSNGHNFKPKFLQFSGSGFRSGFIPCDRKTIYWFFTYTSPSLHEGNIEEGPTQLKQFVLNNLGKLPKEVVEVVEKTNPRSITRSPLRLRWPWDILYGNINKGNVCVAGDAFHPMTPDLGQGGCSALEDSIVLARCIRQALLARNTRREISDDLNENEEEEYKRIEVGLNKFYQERKWRSFDLVSTSYMVGMIQESGGNVISFMRDKLLSSFLAGMLLRKAVFDCGGLTTP